MTTGKIGRLRQCRDFQRDPLRAVSGRLLWRLRWALTKKPCHLRFDDDLDIVIPKSGSGGFIYCYGYSEPETARFVKRFLKPGMAFWDVGAHIGEYTLLAARWIGASGRVDAFEPQPDIFKFLNHNTAANRLRNVALHASAITDHAGMVELSIHPNPARSHLRPECRPDGTLDFISVPATSLDDFHRSSGRTPNLVKIDVEGAELFVLKGARSLLSLPPDVAPVWVIEYDPQNCATYGYHPDGLMEMLAAHGYQTFWLTDAGGLEPSASPQPWKFGSNLVATRRELPL